MSGGRIINSNYGGCKISRVKVLRGPTSYMYTYVYITGRYNDERGTNYNLRKKNIKTPLS